MNKNLEKQLLRGDLIIMQGKLLALGYQIEKMEEQVQTLIKTLDESQIVDEDETSILL